MKQKVTGIILAGGKSSRMGYDKGLALFKNIQLIQYVLNELKKVCTEIIIIANNDSYNYFNFPVYADMIKDCGPLGGIYTGLHHSTTQDNIIVACDMPFVTEKLFNLFLRKQKTIVVASLNNKLEPLCGYYNKGILIDIKNAIENNSFSVAKFIQEHKGEVLNGNNISELFININTPEELIKYSVK